MNTEELMIGDWVSLFQGNPDGSSCNVQVNYIGEYGEVGIEGCEEYTSANCNLLFPIPLTAEILEKNGFTIKEKWAQIGNFGNSPLIMWHFVDDPILGDYNTELEVHQNDTDKVHVHIPCKYVHELQHALRLCGIDKNIEL